MNKLTHRRTIPTIEKQSFDSFEIPAMMGDVPVNFRPSNYETGVTYTDLTTVVSCGRLIRSDNGITLQMARKVRRQPWDMGGSYLDLTDVEDLHEDWNE